ncbi:type II secretion system F family protein [Geomonas sp. Red69]|uniref:type II secretion system F family protein n=1 Tax=Geomonas diazotrophica TaxID=2843197 RepID=UPI001C0F49ED|nr:MULTISPECIES: type II secretion system F family protein [Geomonas]MBU5637874.1 type II secretion system F family protein [Geomonas diazotrophica]QXE85655.1 type II secretion system F family protein [Geomonas nitrogeniifigens]
MLVPIVALVFLTTLCASSAISLYILQRNASARTQLRRRLQQMARGTTGEIQPELREALARKARQAGELMTRLPQARQMGRRLEQAGIDIPPALLATAVVSAAVLLAAVTALETGSLPAALPAAAVPLLSAEVVIRVKTSRRIARFTELFPDALGMIARSLRAGQSLTTAIQLVGEEVPEPTGTLFRIAYEQQQLGLRLVDALATMNQRIESMDLRFFTTVVAINSDIGGNLSELLDKLAVTIKERLKIRRQVRVYTAQGRLSGYVLGALPLVAFVSFTLLSPEYEKELLKEPLGLYILAFATLLQLVGLVIIRKIIRIQI